MDTSEEYAKMCDCTEIQKIRPKDWWENDFALHARKYIEGIWLPQQDQLQKILSSYSLSLPWTLHYREKGDYVVCIEPPGKDTFNYCLASSPEQVFLKLIMLTVYGKKWNGEEWIK